MNYLLYTITSLTLSFVLAPVIIGILYKLRFRHEGVTKLEVDLQINRDRVNLGVPVMGGIIIVITVLSLYFVFGLNKSIGLTPVIILVGGAIIGFLDDFVNLSGKKQQLDEGSSVKVKKNVNKIIYGDFFIWRVYQVITWPIRVSSRTVNESGSVNTGLSPALKLLMELLLAGGVAYLFFKNYGDTSIWLPIIGNLELGIFSLLIFAGSLVFFSLGVSIADGIDGLSAGTHAIAYLMLGVMCIFLGYPELAKLSFLILGAELTFYYFNIPPARVEMSDIGTIPLGMMMVYIATAADRLLPVYLIGFIFVAEILSDVIQVFSHRFFNKPVFKMAPIHHHFEMIGWKPEKIVMRFYFFGTIAGLIGVITAVAG